MPTLSMDQRKALATQHSNPWGNLHLLCDGRRITLQMHRSSAPKLTYSVMTYIDGEFKGIWMSGKEDRPEHKFLRRIEKRIHPEAKIAALEKKHGKRLVAECHPDARETIVSFFPYWDTYLAALNHLCRVCDSVQVDEEAA